MFHLRYILESSKHNKKKSKKKKKMKKKDEENAMNQLIIQHLLAVFLERKVPRPHVEDINFYKLNKFPGYYQHIPSNSIRTQNI